MVTPREKAQLCQTRVWIDDDRLWLVDNFPKFQCGSQPFPQSARPLVRNRDRNDAWILCKQLGIFLWTDQANFGFGETFLQAGHRHAGHRNVRSQSDSGQDVDAFHVPAPESMPLAYVVVAQQKVSRSELG